MCDVWNIGCAVWNTDVCCMEHWVCMEHCHGYFVSTYQTMWQMHQSCWQSAFLEAHIRQSGRCTRVAGSQLFCKHISDDVADAPGLLAVSFIVSTYQTMWQMHQSCWQSAILDERIRRCGRRTRVAGSQLFWMNVSDDVADAPGLLAVSFFG